MRTYFVPSQYHKYLTVKTKKELEYREGVNIKIWRTKLLKKLKKLTGYIEPLNTPLKIKFEREIKKDGYTIRRLVFNSEKCADVPAYLLVPDKMKNPAPAMICLQGHSTGFHISIGRLKYKGDKECIEGDRDFAIQAVKNGFVALAIEQRCFGERKETLQKQLSPHGCFDASMHSLMLGRTMISERVHDVQRGIDLLCKLDYVDKKRICSMGNSGGGTITFYAACMDKRIALSIVSCAFCTYEGSTMSIYHCADNYIPGILKTAEMADVGGLIAPRKLIIVSGEKDTIFPIKCVIKAFKKIRKIFDKTGSGKNIYHVIGKKGHMFYAKESWPIIKKMIG